MAQRVLAGLPNYKVMQGFLSEEKLQVFMNCVLLAGLSLIGCYASA